METMTIQYNPSNEFVQNLMNLIRSTEMIKIIEDTALDKPNAETIEAFKDAEQGKMHHAKNVDELFEQILN